MMFAAERGKAFRNRREHSRWDKAHGRLLSVPVKPKIMPRFTFDPGATIFTVGSCFARNVERQLSRLGYNIPTLEFSVPFNEGDSANGILNKYTPAAILQDAEWAGRVIADGRVTEANTGMFIQECPDGRVIDNNLAGRGPVTRERFFQRREDVAAVYSALKHADCVTITLGYIEAWFDKDKSIYIQAAPIGEHFAGNFEFRVLDYIASREMTARALEAFRQINPKVRFLLTTSPVPLGATFTNSDIIVANMHSKSVLRAVCGDLYHEQATDIDYFPSYEMAMMTKSWEIWNPDLTHLPETTIAQIVDLLAQNYFKQAASAQAFNQSYAALRENKLESALSLARVAAEHAPKDPDVLAHLAFTLLKRNEQSEAERVAKQVIELKSNHTIALFILGKGMEDRGEYEAALKTMLNARDAIIGRETSMNYNVNRTLLTSACSRIAIKMSDTQQAIRLWTEETKDRKGRWLEASYRWLIETVSEHGRPDELAAVMNAAKAALPGVDLSLPGTQGPAAKVDGVTQMAESESQVGL